MLRAPQWADKYRSLARKQSNEDPQAENSRCSPPQTAWLAKTWPNAGNKWKVPAKARHCPEASLSSSSSFGRDMHIKQPPS